MRPEQVPNAPLVEGTSPAGDLAPRARPKPEADRWGAGGGRAFSRRRRILVAPSVDAEVVGELVLERSPHGQADLRVLDGDGTAAHLAERLRAQEPDEVWFQLGSALDELAVARASARLLMDGVAVHFVLPEPNGPPLRAALTRVGSRPVLSVHAVHDGLPSRAARRLLDVVGAGLLLVLLSPVLLAVALVVWARMGLPVFHTQERVGRGGELFRLFKFRSMVPDAEAVLRASPDAWARYVASNFKVPVDEDPRVTPLGRWLRRASLDELPQLWNVLRGDMSLVGPRAIVPDELPQYGEYARMLVRIRPGLTGLWQVSGRSTIGYPERARIDLRYVARRTLRQDLQILLRTLPAVFRQRGAL